MSVIVLQPETDVTLSGSGSVYLFHLLTEAARDWVAAKVSDDRQMFGGALAVEHRYVGDLIDGMGTHGLGVTMEDL